MFKRKNGRIDKFLLSMLFENAAKIQVEIEIFFIKTNVFFSSVSIVWERRGQQRIRIQLKIYHRPMKIRSTSQKSTEIVRIFRKFLHFHR